MGIVSHKELQLLNPYGTTQTGETTIPQLTPLSQLKLDITPRLYQQIIAAQAMKYNTLVVLPTGLGKTVISLLVAIKRMQEYPDEKIFILAPTKPLASQHLESFSQLLKNYIPKEQMVLFTGAVSPTKRAELFKTAKIIFSTPQGLENDILASRINLREISLIVFDEAHRATGEYSYVWVAKQYCKQNTHPRILGLTASPGTDRESIQEVLDNLAIEHIEFREYASPDVKPYVQETKFEYIEVEFPESFAQIHTLIQKSHLAKIQELKSHGFFQTKQASAIRKVEVLQMVGSLQRKIAQEGFDMDVAKAISLGAQILKISHAIELIETQGVPSTYEYLKGMIADGQKGKSKAATIISQDPNIRAAFTLTQELLHAQIAHPKILKLGDIVRATLKQKSDAKLIIFSQYRDTLQTIKQHIDEIAGVRSDIFVGQAKKKGSGLSQKQQLEMIQRFKDGEFNILCMSSVGEEGLDIPNVDRVVFYEPVPSAIRTIQRRGRTGRQDVGHVSMLLTKGTRDVAYRYVAAKKEQNMYGILTDIAKRFKDKALLVNQNADKENQLSHFESAKNITRIQHKPSTTKQQKLC
jgi:ERCC4-related helicase